MSRTGRLYSLKYLPASNDAGLGPEADPLFYSIQHKTSHWSKSEKNNQEFFLENISMAHTF